MIRAMTEAKDDDLLPQTSPEIVFSPARREDTVTSPEDNAHADEEGQEEAKEPAAEGQSHR
jgi:hypothetical protein